MSLAFILFLDSTSII